MSPEAGSNRNLTWITGYDEVRDAFKRDELLQTSYDGAKDTIFADVLITLDGAPHTHRRRAEVALFRPDLVAAMENALVPEMAERLVRAASGAREADLVIVARLVSTGMAARIVGLDDSETTERLEELAGLMAKLHEGVVIEWSTRPRDEVLREVAVARDFYRDRFVSPSLRRREAMVRDGDRSPVDLLHLLLAHRAEHDMDANKILRESVHYLAATAHTSATVVVHACHEIWAWIARHPEDAARLKEPEFVQTCVHEAMRLWPPSGWQYRVAAADLTLESGRKLRKGERLGLNLIQANRDPTVFGVDAERFDPRRKAPKHVTGYGLAFGDGAHVCIGKRLAAGTRGVSSAGGVLSAICSTLFAAGAQPHPSQSPVEQTGTARHQYLSYPIVFRRP
jgi:cytochrome P450